MVFAVPSEDELNWNSWGWKLPAAVVGKNQNSNHGH